MSSLPGAEPTAREDVPPAPSGATYAQAGNVAALPEPLPEAGSDPPPTEQTVTGANFGPELDAPQPEPVKPVGVAGEPVPSDAPAAFVQEASMTLEHDELPTSIAADPVPVQNDQEPSATAPPATAPAARTVLPESFGRRDRREGLQYSSPDAEGGVQTSGGPATTDPLTGQVTSAEEQSRNALCQCGSGKKYKRCHGDPRHA